MKLFALVTVLTSLFAVPCFASTARITCQWSEEEGRYIGPPSLSSASVSLDPLCHSRGYAGAEAEKISECHRDLVTLGVYVVSTVHYRCANDIQRAYY